MSEIKRLADLSGMPGIYRKRPIVIRATEVKDDVWIKTREGVLMAYKGDFVIEGIEGEICPCGREIFFKTYEKVWPVKKEKVKG